MFNLQILFNNGEQLIIPDIDSGEVADFLEEYEDAEQFFVEPVSLVYNDNGPKGGLPLALAA